jgi:hypothetical protein
LHRRHSFLRSIRLYLIASTCHRPATLIFQSEPPVSEPLVQRCDSCRFFLSNG